MVEWFTTFYRWAKQEILFRLEPFQNGAAKKSLYSVSIKIQSSINIPKFIEICSGNWSGNLYWVNDLWVNGGGFVSIATEKSYVKEWKIIMEKIIEVS